MLSTLLNKKFLWTAGVSMLTVKFIILTENHSPRGTSAGDCTLLICSFIMALLTYCQLTEADRYVKLTLLNSGQKIFSAAAINLPPNDPRDFFNCVMLKFYPLILLLYLCLVHCFY